MTAKNDTVELGGEPWTLMLTRRCPSEYGCTHHEKKLIEVHTKTQGRIALDTWIHEMLHATCPWMSEEHVSSTATEIAAALWKLGYRKVK